MVIWCMQDFKTSEKHAFFDSLQVGVQYLHSSVRFKLASSSDVMLASEVIVQHAFVPIYHISALQRQKFDCK